jgi:hypothetical protein
MSAARRRIPVPDARSLAVGIAAGRTVIAAGILVAPQLSARFLGADTATARRVTWLTRMMAVRDAALGVGGAYASRRGDPRPWLIAGAVADAVDAAVLRRALKEGRIAGLVPALAVSGAGAAATVGAITALRRRG